MNQKSRNPGTQSSVADTTTSDQPETFLLVSERSADKLGQRAHGGITYQVLANKARSNLWIRVTANAGSGSFSDQPVSVDKLRRCIADRDTTKALRASSLKPAIQAKSACNVGFTAAALVNLGLLGKDPDKRHDLIDLCMWDSWSADQLKSDRELVEVKLRPDCVEQRRPATQQVSEAATPVENTPGEEVTSNESEVNLGDSAAAVVNAPHEYGEGDEIVVEQTHPDDLEDVAADAALETIPARGRRKLRLRE